MEDEPSFDTLVIGGGIAGLIAACRLAQSGQSILLVEKLSFLGGRFSAFPYAGAEISSGAFHTFPHGPNGPMAQSLRSLGIDLPVSRASVVASFFVDGRHVVSSKPLDLLRVMKTPGGKWSVIRLLLLSYIQHHNPESFGDWMLRQGAPELLVRIFDRFCQFAMSTSVFCVPYDEGRAIIAHIFRYGLPGIPRGGARGVVQQLARTAAASGVSVRKTTSVERLILDPTTQRVCGAMLLNRRTQQCNTVRVSAVLSTTGPWATAQLLRSSGVELHGEEPSAGSPALGLKIHVLSPRSLIDHDSILFCVDTQRIAGILQATNADPSLAPPGKHLLISHQVLAPGADWQNELSLALQDWQDVFGAEFDDCQVIGASPFPASFPVNWAAQGRDVRTQPFERYGVWIAGDGAKPPGLMMVEGVAASAEAASRAMIQKQAENCTK